jgi:hypothetical protein
MEPRSGRGWFWAAMAVVLLLIVVWVAAAIQLSSASAGEGGFRLISQLRADYSTQPLGRPVRLLSFSIVQDMLQDLGMAPDKAAAESGAMELAMNSPVPTATARDFKGAAPYTATPTKTRTPTRTPRPTITPTDTPRPTNTATSKPTSTKKPKPTKAEKTAAPTASPTRTATGGADHATPTLVSAGTITPASGMLDCSDTLHVSNFVVFDAAPSSGMKFVKLKYKIVGHEYIYGPELDPIIGGMQPDGSWLATYSGSIAVSFWEAYLANAQSGSKMASLMPLMSDPYEVDLDIYFEDDKGHEAHPKVAGYTFSSNCIDTPAP